VRSSCGREGDGTRRHSVTPRLQLGADIAVTDAGPFDVIAGLKPLDLVADDLTRFIYRPRQGSYLQVTHTVTSSLKILHLLSRKVFFESRGRSVKHFKLVLRILYDEINVGTGDAFTETDVHRTGAFIDLGVHTPVDVRQDALIGADPEFEDM
jgi:hypothetical protein